MTPVTPGEQIATMLTLAFERLRRDLEAEGEHDVAAAVRNTIEWLVESLRKSDIAS